MNGKAFAVIMVFQCILQGIMLPTDVTFKVIYRSEIMEDESHYFSAVSERVWEAFSQKEQELSVPEQETSGHDVNPSVSQKDLKLDAELDYKIGDTVTIEGTEFIIENISDMEVQLRDPKLLYPIFRAESRENFERLLAQETENTLTEPPVTTESTMSKASARPPQPTYCDKIFCSSGVAIRFSSSIFSRVRIASIFLLNFSLAPPIPRVSSVMWKLTAFDLSNFITVCRLGRSCRCL